jgi:hypothetical protein
VKILGMMFLFVGAVVTASAVTVPEIDAGSSASALALLSGGLLIIKSRWKK